MTFNELILKGLDDVIDNIQSIRDLIAKGGIPENEDWRKAAQPMSEVINLLMNYRHIKDKEAVEGVNYYISESGKMIPKALSM